MGRDDLHFRLRIPEGLKAKIEGAATKSRRSMTAEMISRLEQSFEVEESLEGAPEQLASISGKDRAALITRILDQNRHLLAVLEFGEFAADQDEKKG